MRAKPKTLSKPESFVRKIPMSLPDYVLVGLVLLCVLLYGFLLQGQPITLYVFAAVLLVWLVYWEKNRRLSFATPLDLPILGLLILASLGALFTSHLDLFLPKLTGLVIGISLYYIIVNFIRYRQRLNLVIFALLFLTLAITLLAIFTTDWPIGNNALFDRVYQHLPSLAGSLGGQLINKNTIGSALSFFPPLLLSLFWDNGAFSRNKSHYEGLSKLPEFLYKALVLSLLLLVVLPLLLTQSRGAWLGCAAGLFLVCVLKNKRFLWSLPFFLVSFLAILFLRAEGSLLQLLSLLDTSQEATLPGRLEIWQKAFIILRDFPVTGIGLGAFGELYRQYFASIIFPSAADVVFHAHNTLLSIAVEVGLPGLIFYTAVLGGLGAMSSHILKTKRSLNRVIAIGLVGGMSAFFVFGLLDAFTLGRNLEIIFWIFLGLMSALFVREHALSSTAASRDAFEEEKIPDSKRLSLPKQRLILLLAVPLIWLILSLFSIAWVNINSLIAFLSALILGLLFGVYLVTQPTKLLRGEI